MKPRHPIFDLPPTIVCSFSFLIAVTHQFYPTRYFSLYLPGIFLFKKKRIIYSTLCSGSGISLHTVLKSELLQDYFFLSHCFSYFTLQSFWSRTEWKYNRNPCVKVAWRYKKVDHWCYEALILILFKCEDLFSMLKPFIQGWLQKINTRKF